MSAAWQAEMAMHAMASAMGSTTEDQAIYDLFKGTGVRDWTHLPRDRLEDISEDLRGRIAEHPQMWCIRNAGHKGGQRTSATTIERPILPLSVAKLHEISWAEGEAFRPRNHGFSLDFWRLVGAALVMDDPHGMVAEWGPNYETLLLTPKGGLMVFTTLLHNSEILTFTIADAIGMMTDDIKYGDALVRDVQDALVDMYAEGELYYFMHKTFNFSKNEKASGFLSKSFLRALVAFDREDSVAYKKGRKHSNAWVGVLEGKIKLRSTDRRALPAGLGEVSEPPSLPSEMAKCKKDPAGDVKAAKIALEKAKAARRKILKSATMKKAQEMVAARKRALKRVKGAKAAFEKAKAKEKKEVKVKVEG